MRHSQLKHPLAVLRTIAELKQDGMAAVIGCSVSTVQSIELNDSKRLKLSEELAERISEATGVSLGWLLDGDPKAPPKDTSGNPYTKATFEMHEAAVRNPHKKTTASDVYNLNQGILKAQLLAAGLLLQAYREKRTFLVAWKITKALCKMSEEHTMAAEILPLLSEIDNDPHPMMAISPEKLAAFNEKLRKIVIDVMLPADEPKVKRQPSSTLASRSPRPPAQSQTKPSRRPR